MKNRIILQLLSPLVVILLLSFNSLAQTTEFTYQGHLLDGAMPATANYDFEFRLFDALSDGTQQGTTETKLTVPVTNGIFTVTLDFGAQFPGADRFLDISVRSSATGPTGAFTFLAPRQLITSAPYTLKSINSDMADAVSAACSLCITDAQISGIDGAKVSGTVGNAATAGIAGNVTGIVQIVNGGTGSSTKNFVDLSTAQTVGGNKTFTGIISGNGSGLTNINGANITAGSIATAQLASPPQSGSILGSSLPFGNPAPFAVTFPTAYSATPIVTVSLQSSDPGTLTGASVFVNSAGATGFAGSVLNLTIQGELVDGNRGFYGSLAVVNGNPAIGYQRINGTTNNGELKYVRATDASGTAWGTPINLESIGDAGYNTSLAVVNGNPAICYMDRNNSLKYTRAQDANGTAWWNPLPVDSSSFFSFNTSLAEVNGKPAISYGMGPKFVRATDAIGTAWGTPVTVSAGGIDASLAVVNGNPAISYYESTTLKYVRATDASGTAWGTPVTPDSAGNVGIAPSLAVVNGHPAISYYDSTNEDLKYVRATDVNGTAWGTPITLDSPGSVGLLSSLAVVDGNPAISYNDNAGSLKYVRATDASGTAWGEPVILENVGWGTSLAVVNGSPAISYFDDHNSNLRFMNLNQNFQINWIALSP